MLTKVHVTDEDVANLEDVVGDEALNSARSVLDGELRAVGLVGGGLGRVELGVGAAGSRGALGGGDPQVGGSSVEDNLEGLGGVAEGDGAVVLGILWT
jgi:hypothetical protein